jgi:hypothetical protein
VTLVAFERGSDLVWSARLDVIPRTGEILEFPDGEVGTVQRVAHIFRDGGDDWHTIHVAVTP